jgi:hypothetical protein
MGAIYASAVQVLVYLGEPSAASRAVFKYLNQAVLVSHRRSVDIAFPSEDCPSPHLVKEFLSRRWFHRVWVIQEVGLARQVTVLCGTQSLDWSLFSVDRFKERGLSRQANGDITPGVLLLETDLYKQKRSIVDLLHVGRNALSKDPRDKVFALLSLENDGSDLHISPDYSKPVEWIFTHVAVQLLRNGARLNILSHVRGQTSFEHLPSWVPDWTVPTKEEPLRNQFISFPTRDDLEWYQNRRKTKTKLNSDFPDANLPFDLLRGEHMPATLLGDLPNTIFVRAHRLATITTLLQKHRPTTTMPSQRKHRLTTLTSLLKKDRHPARPASTHAILSRARTLCTNKLAFWSRILDASEPHTEDSWQVVVPPTIPSSFGYRTPCFTCRPSTTTKCATVRGARTPTPKVWTYPHTSHTACLYPHFNTNLADDFVAMQKLYGVGRVLFSTESALGLGPERMRPGDEVWVLDHAGVAMVLRPIEEHYVVIGECYLHEAMSRYFPCPRCAKGVQMADVSETKTVLEIR